SFCRPGVSIPQTLRARSLRTPARVHVHGDDTIVLMPGRATMTMSHRECPTARASNNTTTIPPDACADDDHGPLSTPADKFTGVSGQSAPARQRWTGAVY